MVETRHYSKPAICCVAQLIIKSQDNHLEMIGSSVKVLKDMSHNIGNELDEQSVYVKLLLIYY